MPEPAEWDFPNDATPPGSGPYYVVRFSDPADHHRLARWFAWFDHIDRVAFRANDPGVARLKVDWWREETALMRQDDARHPLAQALSSQVDDDWQVAQMLRILDATEDRILRRQPRDMAELRQQCCDRQASRLRLLCNDNTQPHAAALEKLGHFVGMVQCIARLAPEIGDNHVPLPRTVFEKHNLASDTLQQPTPLPALIALGDDLLSAVALSSAELAHLRRQPALHPALRYVAQHRRLARAMAKQGYASHRRRFMLSPLGLLWSAKRMR
jgi:15-cis-phytoene synthase